MLPTETRKQLGELYKKMVERLLVAHDPDGFAVAAAEALAVIEERADMIARVAAALVQEIAAHRVSVEDLIGELQAMADAQGLKGETDASPAE